MSLPVFDGFDVGETARVTVELTRDGEPVAGTVTAQVRWRNDTVASADVDDLGDGIYRLRFECERPGDWHVRISAVDGEHTGVEEIIVRVESSAIART